MNDELIYHWQLCFEKPSSKDKLNATKFLERFLLNSLTDTSQSSLSCF